MNKYQNNAFRVLGILPSASIKDIMARVSEIKVKISLGIDVVYDYDYAWMGPVDRREENVVNALQRLEDPLKRLNEEINWFWIEDDDDKNALKALETNKRRVAHEIWASEEWEHSEKAIRGRHNQTILAHSSVVYMESCIKYEEEYKDIKVTVSEECDDLVCPCCMKKYNKEWKKCVECGTVLVHLTSEKKEKILKARGSEQYLNDAHWKNWIFALNNFIKFNSLDGYWDVIKIMITRINDPRLKDNYIDYIKKNYLMKVITINLDFIAQALSSKDYERARWHSNMLNGIGFPAPILKEGFSNALKYQVEALSVFSKDLNSHIKKIYDNAKTYNSKIAWDPMRKKDHQLLLDVYLSLSDQIDKLIYEGNIVDINCISEYALARDAIAESLRDLAVVAFHNIYKDQKKACEILNQAIEYSASRDAKERYRKDLSIIRGWLADGEIANIKNREFTLETLFNLAKIVPGWVWVLLVILGMAIVPNYYKSSDTYQNNTPVPSSSSLKNDNSQEISALRNRIDTLKREIDANIVRLKEYNLALKAQEDEMKQVVSYKEQVESDYSNDLSEIPDYIHEEYNRKIEEYNNIMRPKYNGMRRKASALYNSIKTNIILHDRLVNEYNLMIKR